jgi:hypothetical protein
VGTEIRISRINFTRWGLDLPIPLTSSSISAELQQVPIELAHRDHWPFPCQLLWLKDQLQILTVEESGLMSQQQLYIGWRNFHHLRDLCITYNNTHHQPNAIQTKVPGLLDVLTYSCQIAGAPLHNSRAEQLFCTF